MDILISVFGYDIYGIIMSKINYSKCMFDDCSKESCILQKYCKLHWCEDGHPTNRRKYRGYCEGCFSRIMKTDNKKYLYLVTKT